MLSIHDELIMRQIESVIGPYDRPHVVDGKLAYWNVGYVPVPLSWFEENGIDLLPEEPWFRTAADRLIFLDHAAYIKKHQLSDIPKPFFTPERLAEELIEVQPMTDAGLIFKTRRKRAGLVPALFEKFKSVWIRTRNRT